MFPQDEKQLLVDVKDFLLNSLNYFFCFNVFPSAIHIAFMLTSFNVNTVQRVFWLTECTLKSYQRADWDQQK